MNLKQVDGLLLDPKINSEEKIPTLLLIWRSLKNLVLQSRPVIKALEFVYRLTLNVVLQGDWTRLPDVKRNNLLKLVEEFDKILIENKHLSTGVCKELIEVIKNPWGNETLNEILFDSPHCKIEELIEFFAKESGYYIAMRLNKLCADNCEDIALKLAKTALECLRLPNSQKFRAVTTEHQKLYMLDIYIALSYKFGKTQQILNELKILKLSEGLQLTKRFTNKEVQKCRVWKHATKIAELSANYFMTAAMTQRVEDCGMYLADFLKIWIICNNKLGGISVLPKTIRKILQAADSSAHIYICIDILNSQYGESIKSFTTELYIRALTTDMNELEKQKQIPDFIKVEETSKRLAKGFLSLADMWEAHLCFSRECVLTSFSLNPTITSMERIQKCAELSKGKYQTKALDLSTKSIVKLNGSSADLTSEHFSIFTSSELHKVLTPDKLGLTEQLCDDLVVVLSSPRYQFLSWVRTWPELKSECESYLNNSQGKNVIKELKYLNIDYNQFKDWPEVENNYGGIEKGYEEEESSESDFTGHNNNSSDSSTKSRKKGRKRKIKKLYDSDWVT